MIHPYVINQFERGRLVIEGKFSADRTKWPLPWRMGWLIRHGLAQGGTVHFVFAPKSKSKTRDLAWPVDFRKAAGRGDFGELGQRW